jgi:choline dehydrogenase
MLADKAFADPQTIGNPRDVNAAGYRRIYERAFSLGTGTLSRREHKLNARNAS